MRAVVTSLGGAGAGLVWGWALAGLIGPARPRAAVALAAVGSVGLAVEVVLLAGTAAALVSSAAAAVGLLVHQGWRRWLLRRFGPVPARGQVR